MEPNGKSAEELRRAKQQSLRRASRYVSFLQRYLANPNISEEKKAKRIAAACRHVRRRWSASETKRRSLGLHAARLEVTEIKLTYPRKLKSATD